MLEQTQYSEYVGLKPLKLKPWDSMYLDENSNLTNIPQGNKIGNVIPEIKFQSAGFVKVDDNQTCACGAPRVNGSCSNRYWEWE